MGAILDRTRVSTAMPSHKVSFTALVVCADKVRRSALVHRMRQYGARTVVEAASDGDALSKGRTDGSHDLCIVDGTSARGPILPLVAELRAMRWRRVQIFTDRHDAFAVKAALSAGVRGFTVTPRAGNSGSPGNSVPHQRGKARSAPDELSSREIEVLQAVAQGRSNKGIGEELGLSALTVKSHLARIARKLGTGDRAEMVALGMRSGILR